MYWVLYWTVKQKSAHRKRGVGLSRGRKWSGMGSTLVMRMEVGEESFIDKDGGGVGSH